MRKSFLIFTVLAIFFQGCTYAVRYDGAYTGKIVDAETNVPIEGAVVLGTWYAVAHTVAGSVHSYYDARETVTDKNGEFSVPGMGLSIMSNIEPMNILIFKSGYEFIGSADWESLKADTMLSKKVMWDGSKPIIPLKKLTMEERRKSGTFPPYPPTEASKEKIRLMMKEIYKERKERGLD